MNAANDRLLRDAFRSSAWLDGDPGASEWASYEVDAVRALKPVIDQMVAAGISEALAEAERLINEYADLQDPTGDWPDGGLEPVILAAGARHAARIVRGLFVAADR